MEANAWRDRHLDSTSQCYVGVPEDAVDAESPGFVARDGGANFVGSPAVYPRRRSEARLVRRVVGNLRLIEVGAPAIAVPQNLKLLMVLHKETVGCDVVAV